MLKICVQNSCSKFVFTIRVQSSSSTFVFEIRVQNSCSKLVFKACVHNACSKFVFKTRVPNSCSYFLHVQTSDNYKTYARKNVSPAGLYPSIPSPWQILSCQPCSAGRALRLGFPPAMTSRYCQPCRLQGDKCRPSLATTYSAGRALQSNEPNLAGLPGFRI